VNGEDRGVGLSHAIGIRINGPGRCGSRAARDPGGRPGLRCFGWAGGAGSSSRMAFSNSLKQSLGGGTG